MVETVTIELLRGQEELLQSIVFKRIEELKFSIKVLESKIEMFDIEGDEDEDYEEEFECIEDIEELINNIQKQLIDLEDILSKLKGE